MSSVGLACGLGLRRAHRTRTERELWWGVVGASALMALAVPLGGAVSASARPGQPSTVPVLLTAAIVVVVLVAHVAQHAGSLAWFRGASPSRRPAVGVVDRHEVLLGAAGLTAVLSVANAVVAWAHHSGWTGQRAEGLSSWLLLEPVLVFAAAAAARASGLVAVARSRGSAGDVRVWSVVGASVLTLLCVVIDVVTDKSTDAAAYLIPGSFVLLAVAAAMPPRPARGVWRSSQPLTTYRAFSALVASLGVLAAVAGAQTGLATPWTDTATSTPFAITSVVCAAVAGLLAATRLLLNLRHLSWSLQSQLEAVTDSLTGLGNRRGLHRELDRLLAAGAGFSVALLDLDRFKEVNDGLGHAAGDDLLVQVSERLRTACGQSPHSHHHVLARPGGDEFVVVAVPRAATASAPLPSEADAAALQWGTSLAQSLQEPFSVQGARVHVRASVGVSRVPAAADLDGSPPTCEQVLQQADSAMYDAKADEQGLGRLQARAALFEPAHHQEAGARWALAEDLRDALQAGALEVHYQPQLCAHDGRLIGHEALARWNHPVRGAVSPALFIPLAEAYGLVDQLTDVVLDAAVRQMALWRAAGRVRGEEVCISVNLSASSLHDDGLPARVEAVLHRYGLPPRMLVLEVTESVMVKQVERSLVVLDRIRAVGVQVSIDDFGTGFSSLAQLATLPAQELKLDRAFTLRLGADPRNDAVVTATIALAHQLQMRVVAEGVEDAATLRRLHDMGCDATQGYLHAAPMPADRVGAWMHERDADLFPAPRAASGAPTH